MLLNKMDMQEKEWANQLKYLRVRASCFEFEKRLMMQKYVEHLNLKLKKVEEQSQRIKNASVGVWAKHGTDIAECWDELVHNIDYVITNYVRIFNQ